MDGEINLLAFLFADRVIEERNGKKGIIGVFNRFTLQKFPATPAPWFVFCATDNMPVGEFGFTLNITREASKAVVCSVEGEIKIDDASMGFELVLPMPPIQFPKEGTYVVSLLFDGRTVIDRVLHVEKKE